MRAKGACVFDVRVDGVVRHALLFGLLEMNRFWLTANLGPVFDSCISIYFDDPTIQRIAAFLLRAGDPVVRSGPLLDAVVLVTRLRFQEPLSGVRV